MLRRISLLAGAVCVLLTGCGMPGLPGSGWQDASITRVMPSSTGTPHSVVFQAPFEFVSVQGAGQIFTYDISSGTQVRVGAGYATPCQDPSGMVITQAGGSSVVVVVCYDTGTLLTLRVNADGTLSALGSVGGLASPFPGIAVNGTDVYVPLFGQSTRANGAVAKVSLQAPANPVVTNVTTLASPMPGGFANPGWVTYAQGYLYVAAGSESGPQNVSSTVQVLNATTLMPVGKPLVVGHSPQQIAVSGNVALVTLYDAQQVVSVDISDPANLRTLQVFTLTTPVQTCSALAIAADATRAYVGCYAEGRMETLDIRDPKNMVVKHAFGDVGWPEDAVIAGGYLLVTDSSPGGALIRVGPGALE